MKYICNLTLSQLLAKNGFNETCCACYTQSYRLRQSIIDKHKGLSDSGYQDLLKKYGGNYEEDELYENRIELEANCWCDNNMMQELGQVASAPHIYDAKKWVENQFNVRVVIDFNFVLKKYHSLIAFSVDDVIQDNLQALQDVDCDERYKYNTEEEAIEAVLIHFLQDK